LALLASRVLSDPPVDPVLASRVLSDSPLHPEPFVFEPAKTSKVYYRGIKMSHWRSEEKKILAGSQPTLYLVCHLSAVCCTCCLGDLLCLGIS